MISRFDETRRGLDRVIRAAFAAAAAKGLLPAAEPAAYVVEIPADPKNGDFSTEQGKFVQNHHHFILP